MKQQPIKSILAFCILLFTILRRCWYEVLKSQPCLPTTDAALTSVVGTLNTSYAAYQQRLKPKNFQ